MGTFLKLSVRRVHPYYWQHGGIPIINQITITRVLLVTSSHDVYMFIQC